MPGPTEAKPLTEEGTLLGTFQYMAPEQLEGGTVDARTDIFALGAVLYEMATGRRAFSGRSRASLIASILASEPPPVSSVQPLAPAALERLIRGCLAKDPDERRQSAHDVRVELEGISEGAAAAPSRRRRRDAFGWWTAATVAVLAVGLGLFHWRADHRPRPAQRFNIAPPPNTLFNIDDGPVIVSPDGRRMIVRIDSGDKPDVLAVRERDSFEFRPLVGTEGAYDPFWSPDGRQIGFFDNGKMRRVAIDGGSARTVTASADSRGAAWSPTGVILFTPTATSPIMRVSAEGGDPTPATRLDAARQETGHWRPSFLPDGRRFLFTAQSTAPDRAGVYVGSLDSPKVTRVLDLATTAVYAEPGYLLYIDGDALYAQPFDAGGARTTAEPMLVDRGVAYSRIYGTAGYSAAGDLLAYHPRGVTQSSAIYRIDRHTGLSTVLEGITGNNLDLSRDDSRLATQRIESQDNLSDIWLFDWKRGTGTRVTYDAARDIGPVWSPDGLSVVHTADRSDGTYVLRRTTGTAEEKVLLALTAPTQQRLGFTSIEVDDWSRDGRYLLAEVYTTANRMELAVLDLQATDLAPRVFVSTPFNDNSGRFSPDGHWIAYSSNETGAMEVYVQPFPPNGMKWQVSKGGGDSARWRGDGREIFYYAASRSIVAVPFTAASREPIGPPQRLVDSPSSDWVVTSDGNTFFVSAPSAPSADPLRLVLDWTGLLEKPAR
jgi:Tol biopolymer transport system component